jgi:hypothetical protein
VSSVARHINPHDQPYNFLGTMWSRLWLYGNVMKYSHVAATSFIWCGEENISKEVVSLSAGLSVLTHEKALSYKQTHT